MNSEQKKIWSQEVRSAPFGKLLDRDRVLNLFFYIRKRFS